MEIELKLIFTEEDLQKFMQSEFFRAHCVPGSEEVMQLISTYYDSQERRLRKAGEVYRVRSTQFPDGRIEYESTTKRTLRKDNGLAEREEINEPQDDARPKYADVRELFATKVTRHTHILEYAGACFEMAVDKGFLEAVNGASEPIDEVEFEVKHGDGADLENLRQALRQVAVFREESKSKFARGIALLGEK